MVEAEVVKVTCRTCFSEHPYRAGKLPPKKKPSPRAALFQQVLANASPVDPPLVSPLDPEEPAPSKRKRKRRVAAARYISRHTSSPRGKNR
jgi:hypothetical protein